MKRFIRALAPFVTVFSAMALVSGSGTAYATDAGVAAAVVTGGGSIFPGLQNPPNSSFQTNVTFNGTIAAGAGGALFVQGTDNTDILVLGGSCSFSGASSIAEDTVRGQGGGMLMCTGNGTIFSPPEHTTPTGGQVQITCNLTYARVGAAVVVIATGCTVTFLIGGTPVHVTNNVILAGVCAFVPGQAMPPITTYTLACAGALAGATP